MLDCFGKTLRLLREIRGLSQARLAREAKLGKSQLCKYENDKELPKLDSLARITCALGINMLDFFYTMDMISRRASALRNGPVSQLPPDFRTGLISEETEAAFNALFSQMQKVYGLVLGESTYALRHENEPKKRTRISERVMNRKVVKELPNG
jgi:transcriptional regulator with XRE-family HTH domain